MTDSLNRLKAALADRYRVVREFARGGMATVYLAEDLKHHRQVAIKVLRPDLGVVMGPERFLREIDIAAQLQHPHILPLLDSGEADGLLFYVMPFVEEQSLRARLVKEGELPIADAVRILRDVVDALTEAHAHGVVHRDIKPENILLRGRHSLVTDFGVSKAVSEATGRAQFTTAGVALGTPAYMAPEQASADPHLDHRVDIYAVGAVAYELLTGRPVFMGTTPQMVLLAHVTEAPQPVSKHRETVPPALEAAVMRCLEKKPADRFQSAEELLAQLEALATPSGGLTPTDTRPLATAPGLRRWLLPVAGAALLVVVTAVLIRVLTPKPFAITTSYSVQVTREPGVEYQPALSPDGSAVAFVLQGEGRIVVRSTIDVGTGGGSRVGESVQGNRLYPSWTPDGASVRFLNCSGGSCEWNEAGSRGGAARVLTIPGARNPGKWSWSRAGTHVAYVYSDSIYTCRVDACEPKLVGVHPDPLRRGGLHSLAWSPDGRRIAYVNGNADWRTSANVAPSSIWMVNAAGGVPVKIITDDALNASPQWLPDSRHLLFVSDRDGARGIFVIEVGSDGPRGEPRSVLASSDAHSISISADGHKLAYAKFRVEQNIYSVPFPHSGPVSIRDAVPVTTGSQVIEEQDVSPDGAWIAFDANIRGGFDIFKRRLDGGDAQAVENLPGTAMAPQWSPDGSELAFYAMVSGSPEIMVVPASGGTPERLTAYPGYDWWPRWSPDGLAIAYASEGPNGNEPYNIWMVQRDSVGMPWSGPIRLTDFGCGWRPGWAPDGLSVVCRSGSEFVRVSRTGNVLRRVPYPAGMDSVADPEFSAHGSSYYFVATGPDGTRGLWSLPVTGGNATLVVRFDDPSRIPITKARIRGRDRIYFTLRNVYESDILVVDLNW